MKNWGFSHLKFGYYNLNPSIVEGERDTVTGELLSENENVKTYRHGLPYQRVFHYKTVSETVVKQAPEHEHGAMPRFLAAEGCTDVICGGIGGGADQLLNQLGIALHGGAPTMPVDEIVSRYLAGTMIYGDSTCHHDGCGEHHHE